MDEHTQWLASRTIVAVKNDGQQVPVTLRLGQPYEVSPEEWACPVAMEGLHERLHDVHGIDAWQAIQLAQSLLAQLLDHIVEAGGHLLCHDPPGPVELSELFPKVPS